MASYAADLKCPTCSKTLEEAAYHEAIRQLEKNIVKRYNDQARKSKQEFDKKILELKAAHLKQMQAVAKKYNFEQKSLQKRFKDLTKKSREVRERDLKQAKRNYQMQLEDIRSIYHSQLEEMKKNYEQITAGNQAQVEKLQKWLHEALVDEPFKKVALVEQEKITAEHQVANLVQQLDDKNAEVIFLQEKVKRLEEKVPAEMRQPIVEEENQMDSKYQIMPEENESEEQKEWLNMIKELAQQHEAREGEPEEGNAESEPEQRTWGSKVAKRFGLS